MILQNTPLRDEVNADIQPGDDFYGYVNQKWVDAHPIPDSKSRMGAFTVLNDENVDRLKVLLETPTGKDEPANITLAKTLYQSAMDETTIQQAGRTPAQPILDEIAALQNADEIKQFVGNWHGRGLGLVWRIGLDVDDKNSRRYVARLSQSGLGLPDRDYYFEEGERFEKTRAQYMTFLTDLFTLLDGANPQQQAQAVYDLEKKLAGVSNTALEQRDVEAKYNPYTVAQLTEAFPDFDWASYIQQSGYTTADTLLVSQPKFIKTVVDLLNTESLEIWQNYLVCRCLSPLMPMLSKEYELLHFGFYGKALNGAKEQEPRFRRMISNCESLLPEPTGQLFVDAHFDESAKAAIYDLVEHIQTALRSRITALGWMTDPTKKRALEKLDTFMPLLGYPDSWRDYTGLELDPAAYVQNFLAIQTFENQYDAGRLTGPVDNKEWLMSPAMVNAYYWPNTNGITFPAAILQPPFFDAHGDFAANYGGIGMVIGHEITHGFDDKGAKFDAQGNMKSWWTDEDQKAFDARAKQLEDQFSGYKIEGRNVNGGLTLGENIADLGGMLLAYDALQEKLTEMNERTKIDGFTPEQRFFMSEARVWRESSRPELMLRFLVSDPHSPCQLRVNGVVTNVDAFYDAFNIQPGHALYKAPEDRIRIW